MNIVSLIGNIGQVPEVHTFEKSVKVTFSVAVQDFGKNEDGTRKTTWIAVEAWNKTAEYISQYASKGTRVGITGNLKVSQWEDAEGNKRSKMFVNANNVELLTPRASSDDSESDSEDEEETPAPSKKVVNLPAKAASKKTKAKVVVEEDDDELDEDDLPPF